MMSSTDSEMKQRAVLAPLTPLPYILGAFAVCFAGYVVFLGLTGGHASTTDGPFFGYLLHAAVILLWFSIGLGWATPAVSRGDDLVLTHFLYRTQIPRELVSEVGWDDERGLWIHAVGSTFVLRPYATRGIWPGSARVLRRLGLERLGAQAVSRIGDCVKSGTASGSADSESFTAELRGGTVRAPQWRLRPFALWWTVFVVFLLPPFLLLVGPR